MLIFPPAGFCTCPVCDGTKSIPLTASELGRSYYRGKTHRPCDNCGSQYMFSSAKGYVREQPNGTGCTHEYTGRKAGNCLTEYTCIHCKDRYQIDSGD